MRLTLTGAAAILALTATGAVAEMHGSGAMHTMTTQELMQNQASLIRSRDITGGEVYTTNEANDEGWDPEMRYEAIGNDWNQIGEIEDLVLTSDGMLTGIVAEVGGFLDIGDKHVVMSVEDLNLVAVDDQSYAYVTRFNEEDLEEMEGVDEGFWN